MGEPWGQPVSGEPPASHEVLINLNAQTGDRRKCHVSVLDGERLSQDPDAEIRSIVQAWIHLDEEVWRAYIDLRAASDKGRPLNTARKTLGIPTRDSPLGPPAVSRAGDNFGRAGVVANFGPSTKQGAR